MVEEKASRTTTRRPKAKHAEFLETLCRLDFGNLTDEEQRKLKEHLTVLCRMRQTAKHSSLFVDMQFRLAEELAPELTSGAIREDPSFNQEAAEASFLTCWY